MVRATFLCGLWVAALLGLPGFLGAADPEKMAEAQKAFESLYGSDIQRAKATPAAKDDVELAGRLLAAAKQATNQPEFLAILCENACDLGLAHPDGYGTAEEAVQLEAASLPGKAAACAERVVEIRQRQFEAARAEARVAAGEALIDAILKALQEGQKTGARLDEAASYKRALTVARAVKSDRAAALDAHLKALEQLARVGVEVESLKKQLAADPQNPAVRLRLVRALVVDLNDPAEAAKFLEGVQDAALVKYVPAATKPLEEVPELALLELGDWYRGLAETALSAAKPPMFARAQAYYKRFLELHSAEDINRVKAMAALNKVEAELQAAGAARAPARPTPAASVKPGPAAASIDILALVDPDTDAVSGSCARQGNALAIRGRTMVPLVVDGSYELTVRFMRTGGGDTVGIILPVGIKTVLLGLGYYGNLAHGLDQVNGKNGCDPANPTVLRPAALQNNREYLAHVKVIVEGNEAVISVDLDGKPIINWRGPPSALTMYEGWRLPQPKRLGLGVSNGSALFQSAELTMLSGRATLVRPAQKSAASPPRPGPKTEKQGSWIDVLALVDPNKDALGGGWEKKAGELVITAEVPRSRITIPIILEGAYEIEVRCTRTWGEHTYGVVLPAGANPAFLRLSQFSRASDLCGVESTQTPTPFRSGQETVVLARVVPAGDQVEIDATLNGSALVHWQGPVSALPAPDWWGLPNAKCPGLVSSSVRSVFHSVRLRMISGEAKLLRPAEGKK